MVSIYKKSDCFETHFEDHYIVKSQPPPESTVDVTRLVECLPMHQEFPGFDPMPPAPHDSSCGCSCLLSKHISEGISSSRSPSGVISVHQCK